MSRPTAIGTVGHDRDLQLGVKTWCCKLA